MISESNPAERGNAAPMSMYSQLLIASSVHTPGHSAPEEQLDHLLACRRRLEQRSSQRADGEAAGELADNIAYDLALLRVCASRGIECDVLQFDRPLAERRRLEGELARLGIDLDAPGGVV